MLRFHWSMSAAGSYLRARKSRSELSGVIDYQAHIDFCNQAAKYGYEHLLTAFGFHRIDPLVLATALGLHTQDVNFLVAHRPGITSPTLFAQQVNSVSNLINGRICLNLVAGHTPTEMGYYGDFLQHDDRYRRMDEFLTICRAIWEKKEAFSFKGEYYEVKDAQINIPFYSPTRQTPEIYLGGASKVAVEVAIKHASCFFTLPTSPEKFKQRTLPLLENEVEVGIICTVITRPNRQEALDHASKLLAEMDGTERKTHQNFSKKSDSEAFNSTIKLAENEHWITPWLWTGLVPYMGAISIAIIGSYEEVAAAILECQDMGITQFLLVGYPDMEEMAHFGDGVLPLVRKAENSIATNILHHDD